ncbi:MULTISPECIES: DMT family transporter [Bordetella]|uniref:Multidrug DMT transporter permease n=2 Tax=Bordetella TaxID=517 RepID=A0A261W051_9BORD|nr:MULTISPECIES: DMT family transporter [Bordetella]MDM9560384.1 DMT family transporter [Bordetella petrii]OZI78943.1 multidrug DMT transporter permease [Bordetella genomosp. 2]
MDWTWVWIPATIFAAAAQAGRNAVQRSLTATLGTLGATQVRFLFGFPFALLFLGVVLAVGGEPAPGGNREFAGFVLGGALAQIAATALMLAAMRERSFVVVTAWTKTEPVQVALFGFAVLGDPLSLAGIVAVMLATLGVVLMSVDPAAAAGRGSLRPALLGLVSGAFFALSAIGFRGAILALDSGGFVLRATWTLAWSLGVQTLLLVVWMALFNRALLLACMAAWRASIWGGLLGASASQGWFIGFALTAAANVRTLGLVEVLFAQMLSRRLFAQTASRRELAGVALIVAGVGLLLAVSAG